MRLTQEYTVDIEHRFRYATIAILALFLVVTARLYYLQVIRGQFYRFFSTDNSIKEIRVPAVRGKIFDRRGELLVENRPSFAVVVVPQYVMRPEHMLDALSSILGRQKEELTEIWEKRTSQPSYQPLIIDEDVDIDRIAFIKAHKNPWSGDTDEYDLRGVDVEVHYRRSYPAPEIATHVLGYVREIDPDRLKKYRDKYPGEYRTGDMVGIQGLEEQWDRLLKGQDGYQEKIVNAVGREVSYEGIASTLENREAVAGSSLKLTLDRNLQSLARELFAGRPGATVVIDVKTGGIVAMYSSPAYNLNKLAGPESGEYWGSLAVNPAHPLLNRAIQGGYPPGSTYKIVNAVASLSEGVVKPSENINCNGAFIYGGRAYHCWNKGGHGPISLSRAIVSSCDVFFYVTGLRLGVDRLAKYAGLMGFGVPTGIPLTGERSGLIPTSEWKSKKFGVPWQEGETLSIAVGQGYDVVTPLQNALMVSQVANGGHRVPLHFVNEAFDVNGKLIYSFEPPVVEDLPIDKDILKTVREAMVGVVADPRGTAYRQSARKVTMGGKTGTAQVIQLDGNAVCRGDVCKDHAWFIGFAPADDPMVAAAAVVEHGGFGASAAAPIVGALLERYHEMEKGL